jgi:hypothetical protein
MWIRQANLALGRPRDKDSCPVLGETLCALARRQANPVLGLGLGEVFVQRNVGNLATHKDPNCMACLEYCVDHLKVKHVLVVGHYNCGALLPCCMCQGCACHHCMARVAPCVNACCNLAPGGLRWQLGAAMHATDRDCHPCTWQARRAW